MPVLHFFSFCSISSLVRACLNRNRTAESQTSNHQEIHQKASFLTISLFKKLTLTTLWKPRYSTSQKHISSPWHLSCWVLSFIFSPCGRKSTNRWDIWVCFKYVARPPATPMTPHCLLLTLRFDWETPCGWTAMPSALWVCTSRCVRMLAD